MRHKFLYSIAIITACTLTGCGSDSTSGGDEPVVPPNPGEPSTPSEPSDPDDLKGTIYNGIKLPAQWPLLRSASSDIRKGMSPYYLSSRPATVNVAVGRQLFVDNFLIEKTTLTRKFHYPEYYSGNPILSPDKDWEKVGTKGAAFAAPFSDGVWYDETEQKFKMWYMAGGGKYSVNSGGITCYAESADGITWTKPSLSIESGTNIVDKGLQRDASTICLTSRKPVLPSATRCSR